MALPSKLEWDEASRSWIPATGKAGASFVEWDGARWVEGKNPEGPGAFRRGLATGMEQIKGTVADLIPAMVQGAFGYEESSKKNLEEYKERMEALKARGLLAETDYRNVNNLSSALSFAGEAAGQSLPMLATSMLGGVGIGAGAARLGAGRLLSSQAAKKAAEYEAKGMAKDEALALAARETAQKVGTVAGAFGGSALLNVPESYQSLAEAGNASVGAAFVVGSLKSTLDALGPIRLLAKTRGTEFSDKLTDIVSARLLKGRPGAAGAVGGLLETAALEGVTEGTQQLLDETAAAILADKTIDWNSVINSALAGGVGAAPVGAGVGALGARRKAAEATAQAEAAEETKTQQQAARQKQIQETEAALSFPEDYAIRREFGEIKDSAGYSNLADFFASKARGKGLSQENRERYWGEATRYNTLAKTADTENLVSRLAQYYNLNEEQEAALLRSATDFGGPKRAEFETFVAEALKDPAAVGAIPGLRAVEFLSVTPTQTAQLSLPPPSEFSFEVPGLGVLTPKQADAHINSFISRPTIEGADTRDRVNKLEQLQRLDPKINPQAATIDPNERRRLALAIITGVDIQQIQKPVETSLPSGETVETLESVERVTPAGQVGTREETLTYENLYKQIVDNLPIAPPGSLTLGWLQKAAGFKNLPPPKNPQDEEAAKAYAKDKAIGEAVRDNAKYIWSMLEMDGRVEKRGFGYKVRPEGLRLQELGEKEIDRIVNLPRLKEALDAEAGKGKNLGLSWLTKTVQLPAAPKARQAGIRPREAQMIWDRLEEMGYVTKAGPFYKALPKDQRAAKPPKPKPPPSAPPVATLLGKLPPNLPKGNWSADGADLLPNQPAKWDSQLDAEARVGWSRLTTVDEKVGHLRHNLLSEQFRTGYEHAAVFDPAGAILYVHTDRRSAGVSVPDPFKGLLLEPDNNLVFQHSHPNNSGSSAGDTGAFFYSAGVLAQFAHGAKGADAVTFSTFKTQQHPETFRKGIWPKHRATIAHGLRNYQKQAYRFFQTWVASNITSKTANREDRYLLAVRLSNLAVMRTGLIDFADTGPDFLDLVPGWEAAIEANHKNWSSSSFLDIAIADSGYQSFKQEMDNYGRQFADNYRRYSQSFRQPGGFEKLLQDIGASPSEPLSRPAPEGISGVSEDTTGANRNREAAGPESEALSFRSEPRSEKENAVKGIIDAVSQTSRRGFLRGAGSAAMSAGLPGTKTIGATQKVMPLVEKIQKLGNIFSNRHTLGGLWPSDPRINQIEKVLKGASIPYGSQGSPTPYPPKAETLMEKLATVADDLASFGEYTEIPSRERNKVVADLELYRDKLEDAANEISLHAETLENKFLQFDLRDTKFVKTYFPNGIPRSILDAVLRIQSGSNYSLVDITQYSYSDRPRVTYGLEQPTSPSGAAGYGINLSYPTHAELKNYFGIPLEEVGTKIEADLASGKLGNPAKLATKYKEIYPFASDAEVDRQARIGAETSRVEFSRIAQFLRKLNSMDGESINEFEREIQNAHSKYVENLPKILSEVQKFVQNNQQLASALKQGETSLAKAETIKAKYEARYALEKRKADRKKSEEAGDYTRPKLTQLVNSVFQEISLPRGTPAQMQKQVDQMFGRMQRLQNAAKDSISEDYSCG